MVVLTVVHLYPCTFVLHRYSCILLTLLHYSYYCENTSGIVGLKGYLLPPPAAVLNLFYAIGCLVEYTPADLQNVCGDPDWAAIRKVIIVICYSVIQSHMHSTLSFPSLCP